MHGDARASRLRRRRRTPFAHRGVPRFDGDGLRVTFQGAAPDSRNAAGGTPRDVANAAAAKRRRVKCLEYRGITDEGGGAAARARAADVDRRVVRGPRRAGRGGARRVGRVSGLDGDLGGATPKEVRPALSAEDKRNMKLMQDRATATGARHLAGASLRRWRSRIGTRPVESRAQTPACFSCKASCEDAAASARAKAHWATAARKSKALGGRRGVK